MTQLTKICIMNALKNDLSICERSHYTATQLLNSVNISRSTLYYHFNGGIEDALVYTVDHELIQPLTKEQMDWRQSTVFILGYVANHQMLTRNVYALAGNALSLAMVRQQLVNALVTGNQTNYQPAQLQLLCGALVAEVQFWLATNFQEDADEICARLTTFDQLLSKLD